MQPCLSNSTIPRAVQRKTIVLYCRRNTRFLMHTGPPRKFSECAACFLIRPGFIRISLLELPIYSVVALWLDIINASRWSMVFDILLFHVGNAWTRKRKPAGNEARPVCGNSKIVIQARVQDVDHVCCHSAGVGRLS